MGSQYNHELLKKAKKIQCAEKLNYETYDSDIKNLIDKLHLNPVELDVHNEDILKTHYELENLREKYKVLYQFAPVGCFTLDENGVILEVNIEGANLFGVSANTLVRKSFCRYVAPDFLYVYSNHRQEILNKNQNHVCEIKLLSKKRPIFFAQIESRLLTNIQTGKKTILSFVSDISMQKQQQHLSLNNQAKAVTEKNNIMDQLITNIVHELNHPLGVITNYIQGSIRRLESDKCEIKPILDALKLAAQQSYRAADIILRLKNFTYESNLSYENINIDELLKETIMFINYEIHDYPVEIIARNKLNNVSIPMDKIHIQQVIINIARNAIEAMKDANTENPKIQIELVKFSNKLIEVSIIDNGPGFKDDIMHKLVNPNFTTKSYGTGLGLAMSKRIIEAHGGKLSIEKNISDGACFKFTLPIEKLT